MSFISPPPEIALINISLYLKIPVSGSGRLNLPAWPCFVCFGGPGSLTPKQTIMIMTLQDGIDLEFSVFSMGFPCFSREIKLSQSQPSALAAENFSLERLSSEIRVFLDYFKRQFSVNSVDKIIFAAKSVHLDLIANLNKNLGLNIQTLEQSGEAELNVLPDLDAFKAYAAALGFAARRALKGRVPMNLTADLFRRLSRQTVVPKEKAVVQALPQLDFNLLKAPP